MAVDFRVGTWLVQPSLNSISRDGTTLNLEPKVMDVLVCLVQQAGEPLSKEKLIQAVWPDTFVTDDVLKRAIGELRRVFEDDAREPHIIQTIPKRGYRLVAPVSAASTVRTLVTTVAKDSIAVLPFTNMSADSENEFFADGITEEIINALAQIKELRIAARSSAFTFKEKPIDARVVGERLNVRTVLEGSVRQAGSRLRITAQLISAADGYHLWSERYDREMKDIFEVQDEIARTIAERLKVTLKEVGQEPLVKAGTKNLEAYQAYIKGRALLYRRGAGLSRALEFLRLAVSLDPQYAQAWADAADAYVMLAYYGFGRPNPLLAKAKEAAVRAVALDPNLAAGHNALAGAYALADWDWSKSEGEFKRAIELDPRSILARTRYALWCVLPVSSRFEEAITQVKEAAEMDPLSDYAATILAFTYFVAGKSRESLQIAQHAMELEPESFLARLSLGLALHSQTRYDEAVTVIEAGLALSGRHPMFLALLVVTLADAGKLQEAKLVHAEFLARSAREYLSPFLLALSAAATGDQEAAIELAQKAYEIHDTQLTIFGKYWPGSKRLRADRRFEKILAAMGLK